VFIATATGAVYSLDADTGCTRWGYQAGASGIRSGVTVGEANGSPAVFFGDTGATVYALNAQTGELIWKVRPVDHFATMATATPRYYQGVIYQAFSSFEEIMAPDPKFSCCTFRGSVVALDAATGKKIWQSFTILETPKPVRKNAAGTQQFGPSGAAVWSTPTIDDQLGVLYVATGDNYSDPPSNTSDAILAMQLKTGELLWSKQLTENDAYNTACGIPQATNCPEEKGPDHDFGQSPILVSLGGGKRALVIGQKSGMVHAVDPDQKGKILWQTRAGEGSSLGGSQWGSAADGQNVYVAISDLGIGGVADPKSPQGFRLTLDPKKGGGLHALDLKTGKIVWSAKPTPCAAEKTDCSPAQSAAVTAIPGVIFSGSLDGHLRGYSATTGEILWDADTAREFETVNGKAARGGSMDAAGPAVVNGMVFVNSGYGQWGGMPGNVLLAFSVDGK
jgi:polyvinyl alcohol dehydrogenase (cytochrome)